MKLQYKQIEPFVKKPDPAARVVLIYGPDDGLIRERAKAIGGTVVADLNDPFNVAILKTGDLLADPARLYDEAQAQSLMGGRRLIRIEDGRDGLAPLLKDFLKTATGDARGAGALVIIEAGELPTRSPLRQLIEKAANAAALPCYVDEARDVQGIARQALQAAGYSISSDALAWLGGAISGDRLRVRSEIDKLITYMGDKRTIAPDDVQAACGDAGAQSLDTLVYAAAGAGSAEAMRAYQALLAEGVNVVAILRALQGHFRRLHLTRARLDSGRDMESAVKALAPPIFFKQEPAFRAQAQRWSLPALAAVLQRLNALEAQCKTTGAPVETLCGQALLSLSSR